MPWDPKKMYEDRTPPAPSPAPRGDAFSQFLIATAPTGASCAECGRPFEDQESVVYPDRDQKRHVHQKCWDIVRGNRPSGQWPWLT